MRFVATARIPPAPRPIAENGRLVRARAMFFSSPISTAATLILSAALTMLLWKILMWGVVDAVFSTRGQGPDACRASSAGACWAVIGEKLRLIIFGLYPYTQQWRPAIAMGILVFMYVL